MGTPWFNHPGSGNHRGALAELNYQGFPLFQILYFYLFLNIFVFCLFFVFVSYEVSIYFWLNSKRWQRKLRPRHSGWTKLPRIPMILKFIFILALNIFVFCIICICIIWRGNHHWGTLAEPNYQGFPCTSKWHHRRDFWYAEFFFKDRALCVFLWF